MDDGKRMASNWEVILTLFLKPIADSIFSDFCEQVPGTKNLYLPPLSFTFPNRSMKHILLVFSFLFTASFLSAQDTTTFQTFQWSDNFRSATFNFPDDPAQSWRKIFLVYNMRCHNATTGGCGEWDYSCNTFLTDSSRIDSTRQTAPDYVISGFSGTAFEYAIDPTFTYYRFLQHQTQITGGTAQESTVGSGSIPLALSDGSRIRKTQMLFTAAELSAAGLSAGDIRGLKIDLIQSGGGLNFFSIRIKNSAKTALLAGNPDLEGFTEVFSQNTLFDITGPRTFAFYQPYTWDGVSSLLLEWSFNGPPAANNPAVLATDAGYDAVLLNTQPDYALDFGSGSFVNIPTAALTGISNEITVALWNFGEANVLPVNSTIFEGANAAGARAINVHLPWSNGSVYWDCGGGNGGYDRIEKAADPSMYEGRWNHWAFTKNTATGSMKIYLNGVLWHSGTGKTIPIDFQSLILGGSSDRSLSYFGKIDEFQVWDKELDEATIASWMRKTITPDHPDYVHLLAYYQFSEGNGTQAADSSPAAVSAAVSLPNWLPTRGKDLYKNFTAATLRPNTTFLQGNLTIEDQTVTVLDSLKNAQQQVLHYGVNGSDLVVLDTNFYFPAGAMKVLDPEADTVVAQIQAPADGVIQIQSLAYFLKRPARFELLSLVTPYGNGLNLTAAGKTFTFDVTDFAPILRGSKKLSIEFGGEGQEELDLKFVYVSGLPAKPVLDIQNVWPEGRGWYQDILDDRLFEPRTVQLNNAAQQFKLRSAVTGHGQNGEFEPRQHYLNVDGGAQEFQYDVWKYCGKNPIYPQGGTWIFDRAGWCPGMATDVHEFRLNATPGAAVTLDYGINGAFMSEANYLVSNQLVSYGGYVHTLDASIEAIKRPNNRQVEYARINPVCSAPLIVVKNNGSLPITALSFQYQVPGGGSDTYNWTGTLLPDEQQEITLPVLYPAFWTTSQTKVFQVQITQVNNQTDQEAANNQASMTYSLAQMFNIPNPLRVRVQTNNNGVEYSYTIRDAAGNVVMSRDQMLSNTNYADVIDLPNGCYTLNFEDAGNDGLSFWFFPENGNGYLNLSRLIGANLVPVKTFTPDFGGGVQYDFVIAQTVGTNDVESAAMISVYPNPVSDVLKVELRGFAVGQMEISVSDVSGRVVRRVFTQVTNYERFMEEVSMDGLAAGMYFVRVANGKGVWMSAVVKE